MYNHFFQSKYTFGKITSRTIKNNDAPKFIDHETIIEKILDSLENLDLKNEIENTLGSTKKFPLYELFSSNQCINGVIETFLSHFFWLKTKNFSDVILQEIITISFSTIEIFSFYFHKFGKEDFIYKNIFVDIIKRTLKNFEYFLEKLGVLFFEEQELEVSWEEKFLEILIAFFYIFSLRLLYLKNKDFLEQKIPDISKQLSCQFERLKIIFSDLKKKYKNRSSENDHLIEDVFHVLNFVFSRDEIKLPDFILSFEKSLDVVFSKSKATNRYRTLTHIFFLQLKNILSPLSKEIDPESAVDQFDFLNLKQAIFSDKNGKNISSTLTRFVAFLDRMKHYAYAEVLSKDNGQIEFPFDFWIGKFIELKNENNAQLEKINKKIDKKKKKKIKKNKNRAGVKREEILEPDPLEFRWLKEITIKPIVSKEVYSLVEKLRSQGYEAYCVGGFPRDAYMGKKNGNDMDIVTTALLKEVVDQIAKELNMLGEIRGDKPPIYKIEIEKQAIDIVYTPVIKDMVSQRDYVVNTAHYDPCTGKWFGYGKFMKDVQNKKLESIVPPIEAFQSDPVRMLRGARFRALLDCHFGKYEEEAIGKLKAKVAENPLRHISELKKWWESNQLSAILNQARERGLLFELCGNRHFAAYLAAFFLSTIGDEERKKAVQLKGMIEMQEFQKELIKKLEEFLIGTDKTCSDRLKNEENNRFVYEKIIQRLVKQEYFGRYFESPSGDYRIIGAEKSFYEILNNSPRGFKTQCEFRDSNFQVPSREASQQRLYYYQGDMLYIVDNSCKSGNNPLKSTPSMAKKPF